ncbi:MAG: efflux RND transporter periplasmic adaptor subunit [Verrucomicrobiota bacterium]
MPGTDDAPIGSAQNRPSARRRFWVPMVLGLTLLAALAYAVKFIGDAPPVQGPEFPPGLPPAAVYALPLAEETTRDVAEVTGTLKSAARAEVAAREAGAVIGVLVDEGDAVEKGAPLARLDPRRTRALHAEASAALTAATSLVSQRSAALIRARDDLAMKQSLLERRAVSKSDILDAEQALAVAEAQHDAAGDGVEEAKSRLDFLNVQIEDLVIKAPFSGVVVSRDIEVGEWVEPGTSVASLVATDPLEAWLRVPARFRNQVSQTPEDLQVRQSATGQLFTPRKTTLVPEVDPLSQLFTVVAVLENGNSLLAAGESITGRLPVGEERSHWAFPVDALVRSFAGDFVFLVDYDTKRSAGGLPSAHRAAVSVAFERNGTVYALKEAHPWSDDSLLVVEGNERLQPGQSLMVQEREGAAAAPGP